MKILRILLHKNYENAHPSAQEAEQQMHGTLTESIIDKILVTIPEIRHRAALARHLALKGQWGEWGDGAGTAAAKSDAEELKAEKSRADDAEALVEKLRSEVYELKSRNQSQSRRISQLIAELSTTKSSDTSKEALAERKAIMRFLNSWGLPDYPNSVRAKFARKLADLIRKEEHRAP